jgi:hypothetical protein
VARSFNRCGRLAACLSCLPGRAGTGQGGRMAGLAPTCPPPRPGHAESLVPLWPQVAVNRAIAAGDTGSAAAPNGWSPHPYSLSGIIIYVRNALLTADPDVG